MKADNQVSWTDDELQLLDKLIKQGMSYDLISEQIHKSSKAIRGKAYIIYGTENLDKIIQGDIDPQKHEQQKRERNERRAEQKLRVQLVCKLTYILLIKRNSMEFGEFWQKDICYNWHDVKGCLAQEHDCDSCASFIRIRPQYCVRCGDTIISRDKENICRRCKDQRKKQAQRKYAIKNKFRAEEVR